MTARLTEHQAEIERNLRAWDAKPLLKEIYAAFTRRILALIEPAILIVMGVVVVFILISLYLPIFSLGQAGGSQGG